MHWDKGAGIYLHGVSWKGIFQGVLTELCSVQNAFPRKALWSAHVKQAAGVKCRVWACSVSSVSESKVKPLQNLYLTPTSVLCCFFYQRSKPQLGPYQPLIHVCNNPLLEPGALQDSGWCEHTYIMVSYANTHQDGVLSFCALFQCLQKERRAARLQGYPIPLPGCPAVRLGCASSCSLSHLLCGPWHAGCLKASEGTGSTFGDKLLQTCPAPSMWPGLLSPVKLAVGLMGFCPSENRIED